MLLPDAIATMSHRESESPVKKRCPIVYGGESFTVAGYNTNWKSRVKMGTEGNKRFYQIPYNRIVQYMKDKAELAGIGFAENEESF